MSSENNMETVPGAKLKSLDDVWPVGKKAAYYALLVTFCLGVFDFLDRQILAALFPYLKAEYALSDTQLGGLVSIANFGIAILVIPSGYLIDRWSRKKMLCVMGVLWSIATGACAFAGSYSHLLWCRAFIGFGEAGYGPGSVSIISVVFPKRVRTTVLAFMQCATSLGVPLGLVVGAFIAQHWGWRHAFGVVAIPGLILSFMALGIRDFKNVKRDAAPEAAEAADAEGSAPKPRRKHDAAYWREVRNIFTPSMVGIWIIMITRTMFVMSLMAWLPSFFHRDAGMSVTQASSVAASYLTFTAVMLFLSGPIMDFLRHFGNRIVLGYQVFTCLLQFVLCYVIFYVAPGGSWLQIACLFAVGFVGTSSSPFAYTLLTDLVAPNVRATAVSLAVTIQNICGMMVGPLLVGFLSDLFELRTALMIISCMFLPMALAYFGLLFRYATDASRVSNVVVEF